MNELAYRQNYVGPTPMYSKSKCNLLNRSSTRNKARLFRYREIMQVHGYLPSQIPQWDSLLIPLNLEYFLDICWASILCTCTACKKALLDIYGDHSLICGAGICERTDRHNYVRDTLYHIMNSVGLSPSLETANLIPGTIRRPGDVSVNNWSL